MLINLSVSGVSECFTEWVSDMTSLSYPHKNWIKQTLCFYIQPYLHHGYHAGLHPFSTPSYLFCRQKRTCKDSYFWNYI